MKSLQDCIIENIEYIEYFGAPVTQTGGLYLSGYAHPLPAGITQTGYLYLRGYDHPLPAGIRGKNV